MSTHEATETCRSAITQTWPKELQTTAITILVHENRSESPTATHLNDDGTVDTGCLQVNSIHSAWVDLTKLSDPVYNTQVGYKIYQNQGVRAWFAVRGVLW